METQIKLLLAKRQRIGRDIFGFRGKTKSNVYIIKIFKKENYSKALENFKNKLAF